jgi:multidrug efflux pump subunit AcrB
LTSHQRHSGCGRGTRRAGHCQWQLQGTAQAFQQSLGTVPLLILAALIVVYLILGILYESYIHPLTIISTLPSAGVGALAMLMLFGFDFSLIGLIGIVLLIGIVKERHHAGGLRHRR